MPYATLLNIHVDREYAVASCAGIIKNYQRARDLLVDQKGVSAEKFIAHIDLEIDYYKTIKKSLEHLVIENPTKIDNGSPCGGGSW